MITIWCHFGTTCLIQEILVFPSTTTTAFSSLLGIAYSYRVLHSDDAYQSDVSRMVAQERSIFASQTVIVLTRLQHSHYKASKLLMTTNQREDIA